MWFLYTAGEAETCVTTYAFNSALKLPSESYIKYQPSSSSIQLSDDNLEPNSSVP